MQLFNEGIRTNSGRMRVGESHFDWLNESSRPEAQRARTILQSVFDLYPAECKKTLAARIRSNSSGHAAAVAELYAYEMLRQCGFSIQVDPVCPGGSKPEFLVEHENYKAYVEVTTDMGEARRSKEASAIDDLIDRATPLITVAGFGIFVEEVIVGKGNPVPTRFARFLDTWFREFDHVHERQNLSSPQGFEQMPVTEYVEENTGWHIQIRLWPLASLEKHLDCIAGSTGCTGGFVDLAGRLRDNIRGKTKQHRGCDYPLIVMIACNNLITEPQDEDVINVLIGTSAWTVHPTSGEPPTHQRYRNGLWTPPSLSTKPAGLIIARRVHPWTFELAMPELWDNPNVNADALLNPWPFARYRWEVLGSGELRIAEGDRRTLALPSG